MEVRASGKFLHISAKKVKPAADLVRGVMVSEALVRLEFSHLKAGRMLHKVLRSAIANAEHNYKLAPESLRLKDVLVGEGPRMKRIRFASRGHVNPYQKHMAHIVVILDSLAILPANTSPTPVKLNKNISKIDSSDVIPEPNDVELPVVEKKISKKIKKEEQK
jgi:large subunit ribosomal protein L22